MHKTKGSALVTAGKSAVGSHQFNSLMFPIFLLYHAANFVTEEARQTSLLRAPALGRSLLLQTPLVSLAYSPDVPDP